MSQGDNLDQNLPKNDIKCGFSHTVTIISGWFYDKNCSVGSKQDEKLLLFGLMKFESTNLYNASKELQ